MPGIEGLDALGRPDAAEQRLARGMDGSAGNSAELKKAQNQATKNITSEAMNRIMP